MNTLPNVFVTGQMRPTGPLQKLSEDVRQGCKKASDDIEVDRKFYDTALKAIKNMDSLNLYKSVSLENIIWEKLCPEVGEEIEAMRKYDEMVRLYVEKPTLTDSVFILVGIVNKLMDYLKNCDLLGCNVKQIGQLLRKSQLLLVMVRVTIIAEFRVNYQFGHWNTENKWTIIDSFSGSKNITNESLSNYTEMTLEEFAIFKEAGKTKRAREKQISLKEINFVWTRREYNRISDKGLKIHAFDVGEVNKINPDEDRRNPDFEKDHIPSECEFDKFPLLSEIKKSNLFVVRLPKKIHKIGLTNGLKKSDAEFAARVKRGWAACVSDAVCFYFDLLKDLSKLDGSSEHVNIYALGAFRYLCRKNHKLFSRIVENSETLEADILALINRFNEELESSVESTKMDQICKKLAYDLPPKN